MNEHALRAVEVAAERRRKIASEHASATKDLHLYIAEAHREGVPITRIAEGAQLSRQAVYDVLAERPSP
jgi:hypothetical protein